jgi:hypothetical protein
MMYSGKDNVRRRKWVVRGELDLAVIEPISIN